MSFPWLELFFIVFCLITLVQLFYYGWFFRRLAFYICPRQKTIPSNIPSASSSAPATKPPASSPICRVPSSRPIPATHEVIVVNHNSQDDTRFLLDEFKKTFKGLHIVNLEHEAIGIPGKKYPLSMGIKEARHEIVLLTDADCMPASEFWMQKMQDGYSDGIEVVLGYSPYKKGARHPQQNHPVRYLPYRPAILLLCARRQPYMGVGRNLSYKKDVFLRNKGFSAINHIPGGDDDLFINKVATKKNTAIVIDPDTFIVSEPKKTFGEWFRQKTRHYSTAKYYKPRHKFLLSLYAASYFLFYPLLIVSLFFDWRVASPSSASA